MGLTKVKLMVKPTREDKKNININFLVDSGAVYILVPAKELKKIGIKPYKTV
ncbi:MAG: Aspartyl protease [Ignavibacteria bacterium]|nr:Aspartyl protease [Ignavibacteria bacterium]